jgi:hypothetical protein
VKRDGNWEEVRKLTREGFSDITFRGQYPIGEVSYSDPACPLAVRLEAFSPFVPLDADRSSYPATVMRYTFKNTGAEPLEIEAIGWLENPVLRFHSRLPGALRLCRVFRADGAAGVEMTARSPVKTLADYGSLALLVVGDGTAGAGWRPGEEIGGAEEATGSTRDTLLGAVGKSLHLEPGAEGEATFIIAWHFPNARILLYPAHKSHRWYATKYADARTVAQDLAQNLPELSRLTRLWRDCYYGGSLPHWFLERTLLTADTIQTSACFRFADGRFWAWEGVGCCHGTCTHVWHYAQAVGRLFPELERDLRERTDYGIAFRPSDGMIKFRGEFERGPATDGQAGVILRTLREHQMSPDDAFLRRVWPRCKLALQFLIDADERDGAADGIQAGAQPNTLDASWYGKIPSLSSLYLAALRAGEEMAREMGDTEFADRCHSLYELGRANILKLFDDTHGYFIQEEDPRHPEAIGVGRGCFIDQVIGQWWAGQVGLGRILDRDRTRRALASLWDFNFCPDMGLVRSAERRASLRGRPYALAGDAGLVMCTWPFGGRRADWEAHWQMGYFNECMSGFEYQAAGHMIWEGEPESVRRGLAVCRAIHDRYRGQARNPYNEIECSDHYTRAMAGFGAYLAACGFECHGPAGRIAFAPRLGADDFRAGFTSAAGWGVFSQRRGAGEQKCRIELAHGSLALRTVGLAVAPGRTVSACAVAGPDGAAVPASFRQEGERVEIALERPVTVAAPEAMEITLTLSGREG